MEFVLNLAQPGFAVALFFRNYKMSVHANKVWEDTYETIEKLGRGSCGQTYKVKAKRGGVYYCLKHVKLGGLSPKVGCRCSCFPSSSIHWSDVGSGLE